MSGIIAMSEQNAALLVLVVALAHCFAGFILFRLNLLVDGLAVGGWLGVSLVIAMRQQPSQMDFIVGGGVGAILLALLAWNVYRFVFAAGIGAATYMVISGLFGLPAQTGGIVLGILAGIIMAVYAYAKMRPLIMLLTSMIGAAGVVVCVSSMIAGQWIHPYTLPSKSPFFLIAAIVATAILATAGYFSQRMGINIFGKKYSPDGDAMRRKLAGDIKLRVVR